MDTANKCKYCTTAPHFTPQLSFLGIYEYVLWDAFPSCFASTSSHEAHCTSMCTQRLPTVACGQAGLARSRTPRFFSFFLFFLSSLHRPNISSSFHDQDVILSCSLSVSKTPRMPKTPFGIASDELLRYESSKKSDLSSPRVAHPFRRPHRNLYTVP